MKIKQIVDVVNLDSMSYERAPNLIKMDVEGLELDVLRGGIKFLEQSNFPPIIFEVWNFEWFGEKKKEIFSCFEYLDYGCSQISEFDYVAQHPNHSICLNISYVNGVTYYSRVR